LEGAAYGLGIAEFFFTLELGIVELELNELALEVNSLGLMLFALEAGNVGAGLAETAPVGVGVGVIGGEEAEGGGGVVKGEPAGEFVGEGAVEGFMAEGFFVFQVTGEGEGVEAGEPVAVAAVFPLGEVGRGDGLGGELGGEGGLDLGQGIEPVEE
jgi:hypothetical protein